ncbi:hypothetical protein mRhiFer1_009604 [Rhinolophus ferrumequinum]|uniref:Protein-serine/threonine kinase n=1 Tax=Rhinolophus ferrumequinum TaxID=59479 RepID=A0A7J7ZQ75_RHIFE|nr:hypothetical protein mRhiFer1_009604 [Rhinolophus ferrumequinum]
MTIEKWVDFIEKWVDCARCLHWYSYRPRPRPYQGTHGCPIPLRPYATGLHPARAAYESHESHIERHLDTPCNVPDVIITIAEDDIDFVIRIYNRGRGIAHKALDWVTDHHFTTAKSSTQEPQTNPLLGHLNLHSHGQSGPMQGFGLGLLISQAYTEYLAGSVWL